MDLVEDEAGKEEVGRRLSVSSRVFPPEGQGSWLFAHQPLFIWAETYITGPANSLRFPCKQVESEPRAIESP